jgi:hypothetical protein
MHNYMSTFSQIKHLALEAMPVCPFWANLPSSKQPPALPELKRKWRRMLESFHGATADEGRADGYNNPETVDRRSCIVRKGAVLMLCKP